MLNDNLDKIFLKERSIPVVIKKNPRAKRLILRFIQGGEKISITLPPYSTLKDISFFIEKHQKWIEETASRLASKNEDIRLRYGHFFPFLDERYVLQFCPKQKRNFFYDKEGKKFVLNADENAIGLYLMKFLKQQAKTFIPERALAYSKILDVSFRKISYKDMKTCWGTCNTLGNLSFSWRIMMAPEAVIDYLIAHEVAHLLEMNHSKLFWKHCYRLCPTTQEQREWLKINGYKLQKYIFF